MKHLCKTAFVLLIPLSTWSLSDSFKVHPMPLPASLNLKTLGYGGGNHGSLGLSALPVIQGEIKGIHFEARGDQARLFPGKTLSIFNLNNVGSVWLEADSEAGTMQLLASDVASDVAADRPSSDRLLAQWSQLPAFPQDTGVPDIDATPVIQFLGGSVVGGIIHALYHWFFEPLSRTQQFETGSVHSPEPLLFQGDSYSQPYANLQPDGKSVTIHYDEDDLVTITPATDSRCLLASSAQPRQVPDKEDKNPNPQRSICDYWTKERIYNAEPNEKRFGEEAADRQPPDKKEEGAGAKEGRKNATVSFSGGNRNNSNGTNGTHQN